MKTFSTIGHIDHGKTTLACAINNVLEVFEYNFLGEKSLPSKSRLKKCEIGLHEFMSVGKIKIDNNIYKEKWSCIHCGTLMNNR